MSLPRLPWALPPGQAAELKAVVDIRGKRGTLNKTIRVITSSGTNVLSFALTIPKEAEIPLPAVVTVARGPAGSDKPQKTGMDDRNRNRLLAAANRQQVFKGECARCHALPAAGKKDQALYQAACGNCHDSPNRATMMPILDFPKHCGDKSYWAQWIRSGKERSLMPAFAKSAGGPLNDEQIESLVDYLSRQGNVAAAGPVR